MSNHHNQALISQLLIEQWKYSGLIIWLKGIRAQYTARRDAMVDAIANAFELEESWAADGEFAPLTGPVRVYVARQKRATSAWYSGAASEKKGKILFSFLPPVGGMFVWVSCWVVFD